MEKRRCVLDESKWCDECGECERCDLDPEVDDIIESESDDKAQ